MRRTVLPLAVVVLVLASCTGGTKESEPSGSSTPETSAQSSPSIDAQSMDMLVGTWTGKVIEPGRATWSYKVTLESCSSGVLCGRVSFATQDFVDTGRAASCGGTLTYEGMREPDIAMEDHSFTLQEGITWERGVVKSHGGCDDALMALTPMPDGVTLGFEEYYGGGWGNNYGLLRYGSAP